MKKNATRMIAWILLLLLALSCILPAFAAETLAHTVETQLGDGLTLTQLNSLTGSSRRQQFTLEYTPGGNVRPLVLYGDTLYGKSTLEQVVQYAESQGYHVLAGVNSDYFSTTSGVPTGMTIQEGRLVTSDGGWNAVGIREDGTAYIGHPELKLILTLADGREIAIRSLNKLRANDGLYLYTHDFDATTRTTAKGTEVLLELGRRSSELRLGSEVEAQVVSVLDTTATPLDEEHMVLSLTADNKAGLDLNALLQAGDEVTITATTADPIWEEMVWCTGGGNILVRDGALTADATASGREPRTLLGTRRDGSVLVVECDGRQSSVSNGMTLNEGAQYLMQQGCTDVINLDGGGSSIIAANYPGKGSAVLSSPSDGKSRPIATCLLFIAEGSDQGRSWGSVVYPRSATVLCGSALPVSAVSYNQNYLGFLDATRDIDSTDGLVEDGVFYAPDRPGQVRLSTGGRRSQDAIITVVDEIPQLRLTGNGRAVSALSLERRESVQLGVTASDGVRPIYCDPSLFTLTVDGNIGHLDENGLFTAGSYVGTGNILITYGDRQVEVPVSVSGKTSAPLESFEEAQGCGTLGSALTTADIVSDLTKVRYGRYALQMTYDGMEGDSAEYLLTQAPALDDASHLSATVQGSGRWEMLFLMADGSVASAAFTADQSGWHTVSVMVPDGATALLGFACRGAGSQTLVVDGITAHHGALNIDTTPPAVTLEIADGQVIGRITDEGEIPLTSANLTLTCNGQPLEFDFEKGKLTAALPADGSFARVTLQAIDAFGNRSRATAESGILTGSFADMSEDHWASGYARYLMQKGVVNEGDSFAPATKVTNEMAATMMSRFLQVDVSLYEDVLLPYADASKIQPWALPHVKAMYAMGIMGGTINSAQQSVLLPQGTCTRAQIMTILGRTLDRGYVYGPCTFSDSGKIPTWATDHIDLLSALGMITGNEHGQVVPLGTITRAEFAALLYRMD